MPPTARRLLAPLLTIGALAATAQTALALPVETVSTLADAGPGSLRQAIADVDDGGTVVFDAALDGSTLTLTRELDVGKALTIAGPGAQRLAISGNGARRIFDIAGAADVELSGLTLTDGRAEDLGNAYGGAIRKMGTGRLTIRDSRIADSVAEHEILPEESAGGGVAMVGGGLTMARVAVIGNRSAWHGGGLSIHSAAGPVTLRDVTVAGNRAAVYGGGLNVSSTGFGAPVVLERVTVSGNEATAGGGGFNAFAPVTLVGSVVAGNAGHDCRTTGAGVPVTVSGAALVGDATGCTLSGSGQQITGVDPLLGPLALDGPGETETMALLDGSPALDAAPVSGDDACVAPAADQRGVARPQGAACDLGAYEARPAAASLEPGAHDFGERLVGSGVSASAALTLANAADADLPLATAPFGLAGAGADQFVLDATACPAALAPGASCALSAAFAPTRAGAAEATVEAVGGGASGAHRRADGRADGGASGLAGGRADGASGGAARATLTGVGTAPPVDPRPPVDLRPPVDPRPPVGDPPGDPRPPVGDPPEPPAPRARPAAVAQFALAQRCVRRGRGGRSQVGLRLRLTRPARVRIEVARAVGTGGLTRCPRRGGSGTFDGELAPAGTFTRGEAAAATRPPAASGAGTGAPSAGAATDVRTVTVARRWTVSLRLRPALYRITVRPYTGAGRLGRPVHRWLRVLAPPR
jgi:hypothetical protein